MAKELQRGIVTDRIDSISESHEWDADKSFLHLVYALCTGESYDDLEPDDIVDGGGDRQIDIIHIDDSSSENSATVYVAQVTTAAAFSSNKLQLLGNGLQWLLTEPRARYLELQNELLKEKIKQFRELRNELGAQNITIQCVFASLGDTDELSVEFLQELERIRTTFSASPSEFSIEPLGVDELSELMRLQDPNRAPINERMDIIYSVNQPSLMRHSVEGIKGVVCTVKAAEVARIVNRHATIFDRNLRRFLQFKGTINQGIRTTCTSMDEAKYFWFLNNGITICCDRFDENLDPDHSYINLENVQIVNGCQTSSTLHKCSEEGLLKQDTNVLVKVLQSEDQELIPKVILGTNSQNKITSRDLKANDEIQETIQQAFIEQFGLRYERRANEFAELPRNQRETVISNEKIGQACLGIILKRPADARRRKYKIWGEDYPRVFSDHYTPSAFYLAYLIMHLCGIWKKAVYNNYVITDLRRKILANGIIHIARATSYKLRGHEAWHDLDEMNRQVQELKDDPEMLNDYFAECLELLHTIIRDVFPEDESNALKSGRLDEEISRRLHRPD